VKALSPSAAITLRDLLTGESRATRVRRLATPSWLSTRAKRVVVRRAPRGVVRDSHQPRARYRGRKLPVFLAYALAGAVGKQDDCAVRGSSRTAI
jgi:hypothetical protein